MGAANILQGKDASFQVFVTDAVGHPVDLTGWTLVRMRMPSAAGGFIEKMAPPVPSANAVQTLSFAGVVPTAGSFKLAFGLTTTVVIPFSAVAADVQVAFRAAAGLRDVTVTGTFTAFVFTFVLSDGARPQVAISVTANSLVNGTTPLVPTVVQSAIGSPQSGVDVVNASQGSLNVILSEADTLLLKVGQKADMDLLVRVGSKDLNIPLIKGLLNVTKNPFA